MNWRVIAVTGLLCVGAGFLAGRTTAKPEVRTEIREVRVKDTQVVKDEKKTITKRPDGTVVTEIETRTDRKESSRVDSELKQTVSPGKKDWSIGAYSAFNREQLMLTVDRRIISDLSLGVYVRASLVRPGEMESGIGLRISF